MYVGLTAPEASQRLEADGVDKLEAAPTAGSDVEDASVVVRGRFSFAKAFGMGIVVAGVVACFAWVGTRSSFSAAAGDMPRVPRNALDERMVGLAAAAASTSPAVWKTTTNMVALDEGEELRSFLITGHLPLQQCGWACGNNTECHSITVCNVHDGLMCHLKTASVNITTPRKYNPYCSSAILSSDPYVPGDPGLAVPSAGADLTFYMYRAKGGNSNYPLENVDTANIGAVMWYLHNEVIYVCDGGGYLSHGEWGDRKFQIDKIMRYKVTMRSTTPLLNKGMNFSAFKAFDFGEDTGPHRYTKDYGTGTGWASLGEWNQYGFTPGCVYMGTSPMDQKDFLSALAYPNAIWYSLPGPCPTMNFMDATAECNANLPGGLCEKATGQGNCTYSVEDAGWIDLNQLVGITPKWKDRADFCTKCGTEGTIDRTGGCGMNFWGPNIWDRTANQNRVNAALAAFEAKYPDSPKESELDQTFCDYKMGPYGM